jgi:hypothetical protein
MELISFLQLQFVWKEKFYAVVPSCEVNAQFMLHCLFGDHPLRTYTLGGGGTFEVHLHTLLQGFLWDIFFSSHEIYNTCSF